jgi:cell division transport system permease protein
VASPSYHLRQAALCLRYSPSAALVAAGAVAVALCFSGVALLTARAVESVLRGYGADARITLFLDPAVTDGARLAGEAAKAAGEGARAEFISPRVALTRLKGDLGEAGRALDGLATNPLPPSIEVRLSNERLAKGDLGEVKLASARLRRLPFAKEVDDGGSFVDRLELLLTAVRAFGSGLFMVVLGVALFLVGNVVRLTVYARRDEIDILRLVGATDAFIATPFVLEGCFQGLAGGILGAIGVKLIEVLAAPHVAATFGFGAELLPAPVSLGQLMFFVTVGLGVGFLASLIAVVRFLRSTT